MIQDLLSIPQESDYDFWSTCLVEYENLKNGFAFSSRFELAYFLAINAGLYDEARRLLSNVKLSNLERANFSKYLPLDFVSQKFMRKDGAEEYVVKVGLDSLPQEFLDYLKENTLVYFKDSVGIIVSCDKCGNMIVSFDIQLQEEEHLCQTCLSGDDDA